MSEEENLPKGYKCTECGKEHPFEVYVYAHWNEVLRHTCSDCGTTHNIVQGKASKANRQ